MKLPKGIYPKKIVLQLATHNSEGETIILREYEIVVNKPLGTKFRVYIDRELKNEAIRKTEESVRKTLLQAIDRIK